jgi:nucleoside-diphosphate kinase
MTGGNMMSSRTFIILKPDALERNLVDQVMQRFLSAGFIIEHINHRIIDKELIHAHYKEVIVREGKEFEVWLDECFVGKASLPMILLHPEENGVKIARGLLGNRRPEKAEKGTIRGDYGIPVLDPNIPAMNLVHASDSKESFNKEKNLWFINGEIV